MHCLSALAQAAAMSALRAQLSEITGMRRNLPKLTICMGIATGEAIVGTIGSERGSVLYGHRGYRKSGVRASKISTRSMAARLSSVRRLIDCRKMSLRRESSTSLPWLAKPSRSAFMRQWVARAILRTKKSNCERCTVMASPPIDGRIGTRRRPTLKAAYKFPRRMGRHGCSLNASLTCAVRHGPPIGTGFGTFPKSRDGGLRSCDRACEPVAVTSRWRSDIPAKRRAFCGRTGGGQQKTLRSNG